MKSSSVLRKVDNVYYTRQRFQREAFNTEFSQLWAMETNIFKLFLILFIIAGDVIVLRAGSLGKSHLRGENSPTLIISVVLETWKCMNRTNYQNQSFYLKTEK